MKEVYLIILPSEAIPEIRPGPRKPLTGNTPNRTESNKCVAIIVDNLDEKKFIKTQ